MNFMDALQAQQNKAKTFTENGAVAYETSGHALLDFAFALSGLQNAPERQINDMFSRAFYDAPHDTSKALYWVRDCRGGVGERRTFRVCLKWLAKNRPEIARATLHLASEYGRWDDLWCLLDTDLRDDVIALVRETFENDSDAINQGKPISLLGKWLPSENCSSSETKRYARIIREGLGMTPRNYRKVLSARRKYLDVVECKMSFGEWESINYEAVPSKANLIYKDAFLRHDMERRNAYLSSLARGETKINAGVLYPHEIIRAYTSGSSYLVTNGYDDTLEELWKALPDETIDNVLVVRDGSHSMTNGIPRPIDVATALAIYMAEHNGKAWKDKFITFSSMPKLVDLSNAKTLMEKIGICARETEVSDTNIEATMMLILDTAIEKRLSQDELPGRIVIVSDMQFNQCTGDNYWSTFQGPSKALFEEIAERFKRHGYLMPKIVFWNVDAEVNKTIPMQENELGVILCSGFSIQLLHMVMSGKTDPYEVLLETINNPRYDAVEEALKRVI